MINFIFFGDGIQQFIVNQIYTSLEQIMTSRLKK